ncbi:uncharacterized protein LOC125646336 [Ostrea edulis]|uniref:uncharacterized protein LOC125646336 n=1 Tax=Ostrea edulis TaxID=37623 RepID=UPI0024AF5127|nr:uncharacterized protein LOC125646336 [Ostrea edulis]
MKSLVYCTCLFLFHFDCASLLSVRVLKPQPSKTGIEGALLVAPGAYITGEAYEPLGLQIGASCDFRLWVVLLVDFFDNIVNPPQLEGAVTKARQALTDAGFSNSSPVFLAGHSLGGTMVAMYGQKNPDLTGVLLYAAYLTKGNKLKDYPVPVMTLSGDLDGLTRITRVMDTYMELHEDVLSDPTAKFRTPVIVMEGLNHGQFASGTMPPNVATHDLPPDVTNATAYQKIARYTCSFISNTIANNTSSQQVLYEGYNSTGRIMEPLERIKALDTNKDSTSHWTETAQGFVVGLRNKSQILVKGTEVGQVVQFEFLSPKTEVQNSALNIVTYSHITYPFDPFDVTLDPLSPIQIQAKLVTQDRARNAFPAGQYFAGNLTCKDINELSVLAAFRNSSDTARLRYTKRGRRIYLNPDQSIGNTVLWQASEIEIQDLKEGLHVLSKKYSVSFNPQQASSTGLLYCTLLSPFRAMEWIYVDSLRIKS